MDFQRTIQRPQCRIAGKKLRFYGEVMLLETRIELVGRQRQPAIR
ncbi:Uncharacterised protein [Vibrio cholerae]|nr:Uncharacterised protein [Vibrio cholerae]